LLSSEILLDMHHCPVDHYNTQRIGWLCAAVLGAKDCLLSTARLILGVATVLSKHEKRADTYVGRGLDRDPATQVAQQLMARNALQPTLLTNSSLRRPSAFKVRWVRQPALQWVPLFGF